MTLRGQLRSALIQSALLVAGLVGALTWLAYGPSTRIEPSPDHPGVRPSSTEAGALDCDFSNFTQLTIRDRALDDVEYQLFVEGAKSQPFTVVSVHYPDRVVRVTDRSCRNGALEVDGTVFEGGHFVLDADGEVVVLGLESPILGILGDGLGADGESDATTVAPDPQ